MTSCEAPTSSAVYWFMPNRPKAARASAWLRRIRSCSSPLAWKLKGATDLNGDGAPDLIWDAPDPQRGTVWFMRGLQPLAGELITPPTGSTITHHYYSAWGIAAVR